MAELLIANVDDATTDQEIQDFLVKYGFPPFDKIVRVPGSGARPAVEVSFNGLDPTVLQTLKSRIHNMHWKNRTITARVMREHGH